MHRSSQPLTISANSRFCGSGYRPRPPNQVINAEASLWRTRRELRRLAEARSIAGPAVGSTGVNRFVRATSIALFCIPELAPHHQNLRPKEIVRCAPCMIPARMGSQRLAKKNLKEDPRCPADRARCAQMPEGVGRLRPGWDQFRASGFRRRGRRRGGAFSPPAGASRLKHRYQRAVRGRISGASRMRPSRAGSFDSAAAHHCGNYELRRRRRDVGCRCNAQRDPGKSSNISIMARR